MIHTLRSRQNKTMTQFVFDSLAGMGVSALWPIGEEASQHVKAESRVEWGRWLIDCPFCAGAVLLDPEEPRTYCLSCFNAEVGHRWVEVDVPGEYEAIVAALEALPENLAHWRPGQTIEQLLTGETPGAPLAPEYLLESAEKAWREHSYLNDRVAALEAALDEERRGAMRVIRHLEQSRAMLKQERDFAKFITENPPEPHGADGHRHN